MRPNTTVKFQYPIIPSEINPSIGIGAHTRTEKNSDQGGIWTHDLRIRSPPLYRLSYKARTGAGRGYVGCYSQGPCVGPNSNTRVDLWWNNWELKRHSSVRPQSNLESLTSICYWRTTTNDFCYIFWFRTIVYKNVVTHLLLCIPLENTTNAVARTSHQPELLSLLSKMAVLSCCLLGTTLPDKFPWHLALWITFTWPVAYV